VNIPLAPGFHLHQGLDDIPSSLLGGAVAIGNFDGVHRGHRAVLGAARQAASANGGPALALTFEPHPRTWFRPQEPIPRLTPAREKRLLLSRHGIDGMVELSFDAALAALTAEDFVAEVLVRRLQAHSVVVGWDFHFGKARGGSPAFLAGAGPRHGFTTTIIPPFGGETPVSSSAIRQRLSAGDITEANLMLGYRWFVMGEVVHGEKIGRTLGYPTANLVVPAETPLKQGIYAVRVGVDGLVHDGVASFGRRPQFHQDAPPLLESYLFDFSGDLYGKDIAVEFVAYLRPEQRFDGVDGLIAQMDRDSAEARRVLAEPVQPEAPSVIA
jgi:riboflavin kinase/FMN adenylyltransferase